MVAGARRGGGAGAAPRGFPRVRHRVNVGGLSNVRHHDAVRPHIEARVDEGGVVIGNADQGGQGSAMRGAEGKRERLDPERCVLGIQNREIQRRARRSEEHTSELQSLMRISYAVFCLKKKKKTKQIKKIKTK